MNLPEGWTSGTVSANGIDVQYYRTGNGLPIVMAHGMYDNGRYWIPLGSDLASNYDVIAYDARGHGGSAAPETGYDIDTRIADLVGLIDALNITQPLLIGHSMGAATVAWAAATHPDLPRGLILEDPSRLYEQPTMSFEKARDRASDHLSELKSLSIEERINRYGYFDTVESNHLRCLAAAVDECSPAIVNIAQPHRPVTHAFEEISCPTLVLRRDLDVEDRKRDLQAADRLADGQLVHVPDAGHYVLLTAYEAAYAEIRAFLRRL